MSIGDQNTGSCAERRDLFLFRAAGLLDAAESAALERHLGSGCPTCIGAAAEARAVIESLQVGAESVAPPASVKRALMARVRADAEQASEAPPHRAADADPAPLVSHSSWWRTAATAALAAGLTFAVVMLPMRSQMREQQRGFEAQLAEQRRQLEQISLELAEAREVASLLHSKSVQLVSMQASEPQPQAWGRIVWDKTRGVWQLYAFDLAPAGPEKTYELWFITTDERKIPAGTFDVDDRGVGSLRVALPDDLGEVALAAITDEPAGGVPQPTGRIQLVGSVSG